MFSSGAVELRSLGMDGTEGDRRPGTTASPPVMAAIFSATMMSTTSAKPRNVPAVTLDAGLARLRAGLHVRWRSSRPDGRRCFDVPPCCLPFSSLAADSASGRREEGRIRRCSLGEAFVKSRASD